MKSLAFNLSKIHPSLFVISVPSDVRIFYQYTFHLSINGIYETPDWPYVCERHSTWKHLRLLTITEYLLLKTSFSSPNIIHFLKAAENFAIRTIQFLC